MNLRKSKEKAQHQTLDFESFTDAHANAGVLKLDKLMTPVQVTSSSKRTKLEDGYKDYTITQRDAVHRNEHFLKNTKMSKGS